MVGYAEPFGIAQCQTGFITWSLNLYKDQIITGLCASDGEGESALHETINIGSSLCG